VGAQELRPSHYVVVVVCMCSGNGDRRMCTNKRDYSTKQFVESHLAPVLTMVQRVSEH
jgi:hypothetical protein